MSGVDPCWRLTACYEPLGDRHEDYKDGEHAHAGGGCSRSVHPEFSFEFWINRGMTASLDARGGKLHRFTCWREED